MLSSKSWKVGSTIPLFLRVQPVRLWKHDLLPHANKADQNLGLSPNLCVCSSDKPCHSKLSQQH